MPWTFWFMGAIVLFVVEIITPGAFFFACLGVGALVTTLASLFHLPLWVQWLVFSLAALASIYTIRPIAKKYFVTSTKKSNVDALIGQKAWVTQPIRHHECGMVKIEGEIWRAESEEAIDADRWVEIIAVKGTRLEVRTINSETQK
jgi:membrane protein implicated in regulation of membrane protease activity